MEVGEGQKKEAEEKHMPIQEDPSPPCLQNSPPLSPKSTDLLGQLLTLIKLHSS